MSSPISNATGFYPHYMNKKSINPNEKVTKTDHRGSACSTTLETQFYIYNMKYQNKENNINKNISQYFIPSNNRNSSKLTPTHTINIGKLERIYLISMQSTRYQ